MEVNERFITCDNYSSFSIKVGVPSLAISDNCKKVMVLNTVDFLATG